MEAKKCDRCGDFYNKEDIFTAPSILTNEDGHKTETSYCRMELFWWPSRLHYGIDLCPKCGEQLYNWLNSAKEEAEPEVKDDSRCCENCMHVKITALQSSGTINKTCGLNPVLEKIENPGHHLCSRWCPGGESVTFVRGSGEGLYEDNTDKHCESCKWHIIKDDGIGLLHECAMMKTQILKPDTMTCPNWEEA